MSKLTTNELKGYIYALSSAILFGISTPISKHLLKTIDPWLLAGLIYISAALGLLLTLFLRQNLASTNVKLAFKPGTWKWVLASTLFGGVIGPVLLLSGLSNINGSTASLFLNFEIIFTVLLAVTIFKEKINKQTSIGILLIILGSFALTWTKELRFSNLFSLLLITSACLAWAIDNNFIKKVSKEDPIMLSLIKCIVAGITNTILGVMISGKTLFDANIILTIGAVGIICYAWSLVFFIMALRHVGAAKTAAYYSLAPFVGTGISILFLKEIISIQLILSSVLMGCGVLLIVGGSMPKLVTNKQIN